MSRKLQRLLEKLLTTANVPPHNIEEGSYAQQAIHRVIDDSDAESLRPVNVRARLVDGQG